jgi:hypothetical protein
LGRRGEKSILLDPKYFPFITINSTFDLVEKLEKGSKEEKCYPSIFLFPYYITKSVGKHEPN